MGSSVDAPPRSSVPAPLSRRERRQLARCDAVAVRQAELHAIGDLLSEAAAVIGSGWVQNAWCAGATPGASACSRPTR